MMVAPMVPRGPRRGHRCAQRGSGLAVGRSASARLTQRLSITYGSLVVEDVGIDCFNEFELLDVTRGQERLRGMATETAEVVPFNLRRKFLVGGLRFSQLTLRLLALPFLFMLALDCLAGFPVPL